MKPKFVSFIPALIWFLFTVVILVMPGSDIPKGPMFDIPFFDKYAHIIMFGTLTFLFCLPYLKVANVLWNYFFRIAFAVLCYGVIMEFVQKYFTTDRNFDVFDMVADGVGSFLAYFFFLILYKKKNKSAG